MKLVLLSNILEHPSFPVFIRDTIDQYPDVTFLVAGDLLNIFPEPGEDLAGSIYTEIYGLDHLQTGMDELIQTQFKNIDNSDLIEPLQQMFLPLGRHYKTATALAYRRYNELFSQIGHHLLDSQSRFLFIPGNMDYPYLAYKATVLHREIIQLESDYIRSNGWKIGGLGGIPETAHPFGGVVQISPNEMTDSEYQRRLQAMWGIDILVTHISPEEYPPLAQFIQHSPTKILICRAPFNFKKQSQYRGELQHKHLHDTLVLYIRPFEYPTHHYYVLTLEKGTDQPQLERMTWHQKTVRPLATNQYSNHQ